MYVVIIVLERKTSELETESVLYLVSLDISVHSVVVLMSVCYRGVKGAFVNTWSECVMCVFHA